MPRISKYQDFVEPYLKEIEEWIGRGDNEGHVCARLGVSHKTFIKFKNEHPELKEAIMNGYQTIDGKIFDSLKKRALGYEYEEKKTIIEDNGGKTKRKIETTNKHIVPDVGAIALYSKMTRRLNTNDDLLKQAQIEKINEEIKIMRNTGELPAERKIGEFLDKLEDNINVSE